MAGERSYYFRLHLCFLYREKPGSWYRSTFCLLVACLLVACSASNPPRESASQLQAPTEEASAESMQKAAEKEILSLAPTSEEQFTAGENYRIGPFDLLTIDVFQVPELSQTVRVNSQGYISLPLIGSVQISGLTSQQLGVYLAQLLGKKYLQDPHVSVFIEEYTSQRVTVEGAVERPGIYPLKGRTTLLQVIAEASGGTDVADLGDIKLLRSTGNQGRQVFYYDIEAIRAGNMPDPEIHNDDILVVGESGTKVFFKNFSNYFRLFLNPLIFF